MLKRQLSRSNVDLFLECQRCFYNLMCLGIRRPGLDPESFKIPRTIEKKLIEEMDLFRCWKPHPTIMSNNKIDAIPYEHELLPVWRDSDFGRGGVRFYDSNLNLTLFGAIDELWTNSEGEMVIVEFKTTSTALGEPIEKNSYYKTFVRQISFYAWLFKMNGHKVSRTGYFIYCNGLKEGSTFLPFDNRVEFEVTPSACVMDDSWVEKTIKEAMYCLNQVEAPMAAINCKFCIFASKASAQKNHLSVG